VAAPKSAQNHHQPTKYEPCGYSAFRGYRCLCPTTTDVTQLPTGNTQQEGPDDCVGSVLKVGNQLDGQQRKGALMRSTQKPGDGYFFFPESWKQINGIPPVIFNTFITMKTMADGALGTNISHKIDRKKGFFVFPNGLEFVNIGELNFSAALPTRRQGPWLPQNRLVCLLVGLGCFIEVNSLPLYCDHSHTIGSCTLQIHPELYRA